MAKKLDKVGSKSVIEYDVTLRQLPGQKKALAYPYIVGQKTVSMKDLLKEGEASEYFTGRPHIFLSQFESMMELVKHHLEQGDAVNLGGYLRITPVLNGKLGASRELTRENTLAVRVTALSKLKVKLTNFAWRLRGDRVKRI